MNKPKILVIDDSELFQETIKAVLLLADFEVLTASNGKEGLDRIYKDSPDLILLDCVMPEMDGYEVVKAMREDPLLSNKAVIMLTGKDTEYDEIKGLTFGIDDYVVKPFNPSVLIARVNAILQRKAQSISANPLTLLSGNTVIKQEAEKRLAEHTPFSMIYVDLNNFKSFNDKYGFQRGDEVIKNTASILIRAVKEYGQKGDFIGHIGGDDFIVLASPDSFDKLAQRIIELFDSSIKNFYDPEDQKRGFIVSQDRNNNLQQFPMMTISIAVISTAHTNITHYGQLSQIAAELKKVAKKSNKSTYAVDRRKEC